MFMCHRTSSAVLWDNGNSCRTTIKGYYACSGNFPISRSQYVHVASDYDDLFRMCAKFQRKLYFASPEGSEWSIPHPEAFDTLVDETINLARSHGFVAVRSTTLFRPLKQFHIDPFHFGVNRNDEGPANEFHQLWVKVINTAETAATFLTRPESWTECMKSIPKDVMPEVLDDYESIMHESIGRDINIGPSLRDD